MSRRLGNLERDWPTGSPVTHAQSFFSSVCHGHNKLYHHLHGFLMDTVLTLHGKGNHLNSSERQGNKHIYICFTILFVVDVLVVVVLFVVIFIVITVVK